MAITGWFEERGLRSRRMGCHSAAVGSSKGLSGSVLGVLKDAGAEVRARCCWWDEWPVLGNIDRMGNKHEGSHFFLPRAFHLPLLLPVGGISRKAAGQEVWEIQFPESQSHCGCKSVKMVNLELRGNR